MQIAKSGGLMAEFVLPDYTTTKRGYVRQSSAPVEPG